MAEFFVLLVFLAAWATVRSEERKRRNLDELSRQADAIVSFRQRQLDRTPWLN